MADRIEDLRSWWDRTRKRQLKPQVRSAVARVRPSSEASPAAIAGSTPPESPDRTGPASPAVDSVAVGADAQAVSAVDATPAIAAIPVDVPEHDLEPAAMETEPGPGSDQVAATDSEVAPEPWSTTPAAEPDGPSADPFAPDWIADAVEESAVDGAVQEQERSSELEDAAGAEWMITDPAAALERPGVAGLAVADAAHHAWGEDEGVAPIEPVEPTPPPAPEAPADPDPWTTVPVASADEEQSVADWSDGSGVAVAVMGGAEVAAGPGPDAGTEPEAVTAPDAGTEPDEGTESEERTEPEAGTEPDSGTEPEAVTESDEGTEPDAAVARDAELGHGTAADDVVIVAETAEPDEVAGEDHLPPVELADLPAMAGDGDGTSIDGLAAALPELQWAAPGSAPWETPVVASVVAAEVATEAVADEEPAAEPAPAEATQHDSIAAPAEPAPSEPAEPAAAPEPAPLEPMGPEPSVDDAGHGSDGAAGPGGTAAALDPWLVAPGASVAVAEPEVAAAPVAAPTEVAAAAVAASTEDAAAPPAPAQTAPPPPPDPWAVVTWSAAEQPAPWTAGAAAADQDPLDLDEDQRRWLGRDARLVEGIGPGYGAQLDAVGIATLQDLLLRGATRRGRQEIADSTGISGKLILRWVNNADLFRVRGVGTQYADLLEAAGVDTVVELALRRADNLTARLATTNEIRRLVRQVPTEAQVADWIRQARELPRIVAY